MNISIYDHPEDLGKAAAQYAAGVLNEVIADKGNARIVLSTGSSQFETIHYLLKEEILWNKVEVFHLDEYIELSANHPASFRKYLKERFLDFVEVKNMYFVETEGDIYKNIATLTEEIRKEPIDLAFIGIGENAHIAFNDPPADFDRNEAYIVVDLDEACKRQQVGEGFFSSIDEVPRQAVSMTIHQIMQSRVIISCVPDERKMTAIKNTLENGLTKDVPATILKKHPDFHLYLDKKSAGGFIRF